MQPYQPGKTGEFQTKRRINSLEEKSYNQEEAKMQEKLVCNNAKNGDTITNLNKLRSHEGKVTNHSTLNMSICNSKQTT